MFWLACSRIQAYLTRSSIHPDVVFRLPSDATFVDTTIVFLSGQGGIEVSLFLLVVFSINIHRLPSLFSADSKTRQRVLRLMKQHTALGVLLAGPWLFPSDAYQVVTFSPSLTEPIMPSTWQGIVLLVSAFCFAMTGELFASSHQFTHTKNTQLMFNRAYLKLFVALAICWVFIFTREVLNDATILRPDAARFDAIILSSVLYASFAGLMVIPSAVMEQVFGHHQHQALSNGAMVGVCLILLVAHSTMLNSHDGIDYIEEGQIWYILTMVAPIWFFCSLLLFLPTLGFDHAHRPERWWWRIGNLIAITFLPLLNLQAWALLPALMMCGLTSMLIGWAVERHPYDRMRRISLALLVMMNLISFVLIWAPSHRTNIVSSILVMNLLSAVGFFMMFRLLVERHPPKKPVQVSN